MWWLHCPIHCACRCNATIIVHFTNYPRSSCSSTLWVSDTYLVLQSLTLFAKPKNLPRPFFRVSFALDFSGRVNCTVFRRTNHCNISANCGPLTPWYEDELGGPWQTFEFVHISNFDSLVRVSRVVTLHRNRWNAWPRWVPSCRCS